MRIQRCNKCGNHLHVDMFGRTTHTCKRTQDDTEKLKAVKPPAQQENQTIEEITYERAWRVYLQLVKTSNAHASLCTWCDMLAEDGRVCFEQQRIFSLRDSWLERSIKKEHKS